MGLLDFFKSRQVSDVEYIPPPVKVPRETRIKASDPVKAHHQYHFLSCPNCEHPFEIMPQKSGTCNHCRKKYYICKDNETREQLLTTAAGRQEILLKNRNLNRYVEWFYPFSQTSDKTSSEKIINGMIQVKNEWFKKFPDRTFNDFLLSMLNSEIYTAIQNKDSKLASQYHNNMAVLLNEEGKDNNKILSEAHTVYLLNLKETLRRERKKSSDSHIIVTIQNSGAVLCENCAKVVGKEMLLDEALQLKLLPVKDCTCKNGYCDCWYFDVWKLNELDHTLF